MSLKAYVVGLVVLFIVVAGAGTAYDRGQVGRDARAAAVKDARFAAGLAAHDVDASIGLLEATVGRLAAAPGIEQAFVRPNQCSLTFAGAGPFTTGHLDIVGSDGSVGCSSVSTDESSPYGGAEWLNGALAGPLLAGPLVDARTGKRVVLAAAPVTGHGVAVGFLNLDALGPGLTSTYGGYRQLEFLVVSGDDKQIVARSIDPDRWVGVPLAGTPFAAAGAQDARPDVGGTPRLYGESIAPSAGWKVYAGADRASTLSASSRLIRKDLAITSAGLLVILVAASVLYRRIARPIHQLSVGVRAATAHAIVEPVKASGPRELVSLGEDLQSLIATRNDELAATSRLAAIVESSTDAIVGMTLGGIVTSWNAGAENMYGYTEQEMAGREVSLIIPPDRFDELLDIREHIRRGEQVEHFESERVRKDGTIIDVSIAVSPVRDMGGATVGASAVTRDISEEKLAAKALRASEARKAAILDAALDCVVTMDHEGTILEFNPAAER
ncbi:MAG: hypothetical protein QOD72_80, partial [Acidimicrobiaceae bacterium]|nr:hypothetical protein [Acidimicrobiaceae bacterium]